MKKMNVAEKFWSRVNKTEKCWLWQGCLTNGYGKICSKKKAIRAHRFAFEQLKGPIPKGMQLDHLCRVRNCVRPDHLEIVTGAENSRRGVGFAGINAQRKYCKSGHQFTEKNTYRNPTNGQRTCRACHKKRNKAYWRSLIIRQRQERTQKFAKVQGGREA
jgi:hypothetical protein